MSASYETLAAEYYRAALHPTSANLREASLRAIAALLAGERYERVCEFGAGRSVFLDLHDIAMPRELLLVDESAAMLEHSSALTHARTLVCDLTREQLSPGAFDLVIASLGDPYNTHAAWENAARILAPGGRLIYTGPSIAWAAHFRDEHQAGRFEQADFVAEAGNVSVRSFVFAQAEQVAMWRAANFETRCWIDIYPADLTRPLSPKILDRDEPLACAALAQKV